MLKFAKFIGANTDFATAQAFLFPRILPEKIGGFVFGLVVSGEGEDIFVKVRQKALNMEGVFNEPFERITDRLHEIFEKLKSEFSEVENLKLTLFAASENLFYVLALGDNLVEIWREGKRSSILQNNFTREKIVSGILRSGDRVLVLSSKTSGNWSDDAIIQIFLLPNDNIPDAEVIFAQEELKTGEGGDLARVRNIQPVAFIRVENEIEGVRKETAASAPQITKKDFKIRAGLNSVLLAVRKIIRQGFGLIRQINERVLLVNKTVLITALVLLLLIVTALGGFIYYQAQLSAKNTRRDNLIILIEASLNQAKAVKDNDQKAAREELTKAQEKLKELEGIDRENPRVLETRKRYEEAAAEVLKIYNNFDLELFLSLDLINANYQTKKMSFSLGKALLLDSNEKSLVAIDLKLKTPQILAGSQQLGDANLASINGSDVFVYSQDKGIIHIDTDSEKLSTVSKPDEGWGSIKDIFGFSGNAYVLDSGNPPAGGMIWKYAPGTNGFSQKQEYLRGEADLSSGKKLVIDYSVWVLTSEPDILKFTAGNSDFYALSGLEEPLTQIDGLFVPEELDSVFILDKSKARIIVTKKNGEYLAQYVKPELGKVDDFFVDEEGKLIYLLIESKIYRTGLK